MSGSPITFLGQHFLNLALGVILIGLVIYLCNTQRILILVFIAISFLVGVLLIIPMRAQICLLSYRC